MSDAPRVLNRLALAALTIGAACARPELPPGGPEDRLPPIVVETSPDTFAVVEAGLREFRFRFSERISERPTAGNMSDAVIISPAIGNIRVSPGRDRIDVQVQGGLEPGRVYRVTVLPVINDMFGNRMVDPFDLVLSTGPSFEYNVVAGAVEDRVTGRPVEDAKVEALFTMEGDTVRHWNVSDRDGIFALRYVPGGSFQLRGWQDRNRDGIVDATEPQTRFSLGLLPEPPDTSFTVLSLIEPDTSRAQLLSAEAVDSITLIFEFDDHLDPAVPSTAVRGSVTKEEDGTAIPVRVMQEAEYLEWVSEQADSATLAAAREAAQDPDVIVARSGSAESLSGLPLPFRSLYGILDTPLEEGVPYQTTVSGVINIAGAPLGGGMALVVWERPDTAELDADPDSGQAAESIGVDTLAVDTLGVDTLVVDTLVVDTLVVDTLVVDTLVVDTLVVDTLRVDTLGLDARLPRPPARGPS